MQVILYQNQSADNKINKNIIQQNNFTCVVKQNTSLLEPTIVISKINISNISNCNYMYLDTFERYYFIRNIRACVGCLVEVDGKVDVLMSNRNNILRLTPFITRQEQINNMYFTDNNLPIQNKHQFMYLKIGELPNITNYFLTVNGGVQDDISKL